MILNCTGVKVCEFLSQDLKNLHHESTSEYIWNTIERKRKELSRYENPQLEKQKFSNR